MEREVVVHTHWTTRAGAFALFLAAAALLPTGVGAITAEVAKKCNLLLQKQFPPRQADNPAAECHLTPHARAKFAPAADASGAPRANGKRRKHFGRDHDGIV